jgi:hypothetical protein
MAFSTVTIGQLIASGRNYTSTIAGFIGGVGLMSASQSKGLTDAFADIFNGLAMVVSGATNAWGILIVAFPIIGGIMAKFASNSASLPSQAAAVKAAVADPNTPVPIEAKADILDATAGLDEVKEPIKVTDPTLAAVTDSPLIKAA